MSIATKLAAIALAIAAVFPTSAKPASFASASMTNFSVNLLDLDPLDGVTPAITFGPLVLTLSASITDGAGNTLFTQGSAPIALAVTSAQLLPDGVTGRSIGTLREGFSGQYEVLRAVGAPFTLTP